MKISELVTALRALQDEHGDLPVWGVFDAGFGVPLEIDCVYRSVDGWVAVDMDGLGRGFWEHPDDASRSAPPRSPTVVEGATHVRIGDRLFRVGSEYQGSTDCARVLLGLTGRGMVKYRAGRSGHICYCWPSRWLKWIGDGAIGRPLSEVLAPPAAAAPEPAP